jgi:hypothetical protein
LVLLDAGWSCQEAAKAFLPGDGTIRGWRKLFEQRGIEGLTSFDRGEVIVVSDHGGGSARFLSAGQEDDLKVCIVWGSRISSPAQSRASSAKKSKRRLSRAAMISLADNEAVLFAGAVHPTHAARPAGGPGAPPGAAPGEARD